MQVLLAFDGDRAGREAARKSIVSMLRELPHERIGNEFWPYVMMYQWTTSMRPRVMRLRRGTMSEAEIIRKFHPEIRRMPDWELESSIKHYQRECVEIEISGLPPTTARSWLEALTQERERREKLAREGAPPYDGGAKSQHQTVYERVRKIKQWYTGTEFLELFQDVTGIEPIPYGRKWRYRCPLHGDGIDKNPSGSLDPDRGLWHCFVCNTGGDIFHLLYAWRQMTFMEAFDELQERMRPHVLT